MYKISLIICLLPVIAQGQGAGTVSLSSAVIELDSPQPGFNDLGYRFILENTVSVSSADGVWAAGEDYWIDRNEGRIFIVKEGRLLTPAAGTILRSITRKSVLEMTRVLDIESAEIRLLPEDLFQASEIFFSGTPMKILPVSKMETWVIEEVPGPITRQFFLLMEGIVSGRDARFQDWLFPVD